jgi:TRAP-type C4-dicarboxylate transport system permease small subunit
VRRALEIAAAALGLGLSLFFAWFAVKSVRISHLLADVSQGQDATPLWIPQLAMAAGTVLLAVAMLDHLVVTVRRGDPTVGADRPSEV